MPNQLSGFPELTLSRAAVGKLESEQVGCLASWVSMVSGTHLPDPSPAGRAIFSTT